MNYRKLVLAGGITATSAYMICTMIAFLRYPLVYSPFANWLSDLGNPIANPNGAFVYNLGCILVGLSLLVFSLGLRMWEDGTKRTRILLVIAQLANGISALFLIAAALFPLGTYTTVHSITGKMHIFFAGFFLTFSATILLGRSQVQKWFAWFGFMVALVNFIYGAFLHSVYIAEWAAIGLFIVYVLLVSASSEVMKKSPTIETVKTRHARAEWMRGWQGWAPYVAVAWSLIYAALGIYWAISGRGFPYASNDAFGGMGPLVGRLGAGLAWVVVILAGLPAVGLGAAMLRGMRSMALRPLFITIGALLAGALLLLMTDLNLLTLLAYIPFTIFRLITGGDASFYLREMVQAKLAHQLWCLVGGFIWLGATVSYARRSGEACLYCGRKDGPEGWTSPEQARHWGRIAVYVSMAAPLFYALTRYAWALGIPLGMSQANLRLGQEKGLWISGLFLATFALVGALLMLGLIQRWGEVFPRWMIGLAGNRVPIALAVIPAGLVSVVLVVGGIVIWSGLAGMVANLAASGVEGRALIGAIIFQVGPTLLFPVWGGALAVATLGYYYRRRGQCRVCGRGGLSQPTQQRVESVV